MTEDRLLTIEEVAERLRVSDATVRRQLKRKGTKGLKASRVGLQLRIRESEVDRFLRANEEEGKD